MTVPTDRGEPRRWKKEVVVFGRVVAVLGLFAVALVVAVSWFLKGQSDQDDCCWRDNVSVDRITAHIGLKIPEEATDQRVALKIEERWDTAIFAFSVSAAEGSAYLDDIIPDRKRAIGNNSPISASDDFAFPFSRLDLVEPETITSGILKTRLCPLDAEYRKKEGLPPYDSIQTRNLNSCVNIWVHSYGKDKSRIYVRSTFTKPYPTTSAKPDVT